MTHLRLTHQLYVYTPSSASREEVERGFPLRETEGMMSSPPRYVYILLIGDLNDEQLNWLTSQKAEGNISDWKVTPISVMTGTDVYSNTGITTVSTGYEQDTKEQDQVSGRVDSTKQLRLAIELVPNKLWGVNLHKILRRSVWNKLREQVIAQQNTRCGICQAENVTLTCHEIWQYDDMSHIQTLTGLIAICAMCNLCKHLGRTKILAVESKVDLSKMVEHFMHVNQCFR